MKTSVVEYTGNLRTQATHLRSGNTIMTDAPVDNQGLGEAFSPTDMVATALASCMMTIMGIAAQRHHFNIDGTRAEVEKVMMTTPRRIGAIHLNITLPHNEYTSKQRRLIESAANSCPVAQSLHQEIQQVITFNYTNQTDNGDQNK